MTSIPQLLPAVARVGLGVTLDGLPFNQGAVDENGVEHYLSDLEGWDSPNLRTDLDDRPLAHGAFRGTSYYGTREIGLKGALVSPGGIEALRVAKDRLAYVTDLTDTDAVLTVAESPAKQTVVRRSGRLRYAQVGKHLLRWELDLTAADPRKYSQAVRSLSLGDGEQTTAPNLGTFRGGAPLRVEFTAAGTLHVGAAVLQVRGAATIDTVEGTVMNGPATAYQQLVSTEAFPTLPPLTSTPVTYRGAGRVLLTWRDTWI